MPTVGTRVVGERYRLRQRLAAGGVGEVWRADDTVLDRPVAVKLLRPEHADNEEYRERLRLEGRHLAGLSHPRLAGVYDYGDGPAGERPYLVMELIDGESLSAVLAREHTLPPRRVVDIVAQAADGLACVHAAGLVHRDMKPANLLIRPDDSVKITDFGIARGPEALRLTRTGEVIGTPLYLAPEQAAGQGVSPAGDLYSLGVIAWECLTGRPPFQGDDVLAVAIAHRDRPVPPLPGTVPGSVRELVRALTAKDPAARPDAPAVAAWAGRLCDDPVVAAAPSGPVVAGEHVGRADPDTTPEPVEASPPPNRRGLMLGVGAVVFAALSGASGWALRRTDTPDRARGASTGPRKVALDPARYYGHPVTAVTADLRRVGLRVSVRHQVVPGRRAGTVVGIAPSGEVPVGTTVVVYAARTPPSPSPRADGGDRTGAVARPAGEAAAPPRSEHKSKGQVKAKGKGHGKKG